MAIFPDVLMKKPRPLPEWAPGIALALFLVPFMSGLGVLIGFFPLTEGLAQSSLASTRPVWASIVESKVLRDDKGTQRGIVKVQWRDARGTTHTESVNVAPGWAASQTFKPGSQKQLYATTSMMGTRIVALRESLGETVRFGRNMMYIGAGIIALLVLAGLGNFVVTVRRRSLLRNGAAASARVTDAYWERTSASNRADSRRGKKPAQPKYVVRYEVTTQDGQRFMGKETFSAPLLAKVGHMSAGDTVYVVHIGKRSCVYGTPSTRWPTLRVG